MVAQPFLTSTLANTFIIALVLLLPGNFYQKGLAGSVQLPLQSPNEIVVSS